VWTIAGARIRFYFLYRSDDIAAIFNERRELTLGENT